MPTTTLRLEHAELCTECVDLLPAGTTVVIDEGFRVICLSCVPEHVGGFQRTDPWTWIDDDDLHEQLCHRHDRELAISA